MKQMCLDNALVVVHQRSNPDGSYPDFDIRQMRDALEYTGMAGETHLFYMTDFEEGVRDKVLLHNCDVLKPQVILMCLQGYKAGKQPSLSVATVEFITKVLKIPVVIFWFDIHSDDYVDVLNNYSHAVSLNMMGCTAPSMHKPLNPNGANCVYSGLSYDERCFDLPEVERDIPIGFLGSIKGNRETIINGLAQKGLNTFISGGQMTKQWMDFSEYCKLTKRFKIALSFSATDSQAPHQMRTWLKSLIKHPGNVLNIRQIKSALKPVTEPTHYQLRSRVFEALWLKTFVLEEDNPITSIYLEPYKDYVPYSNPEDLIDKVNYYLKHDNERGKIRLHGYNTVRKYYNAKNYFTSIFESVDIPKGTQKFHLHGETWNKEHFKEQRANRC